MFERLAGRVKWEQTGDGVRLVVPVRRRSIDAFFGIFLVSLLAMMDLFDYSRPARFVHFCIGLSLAGIYLVLSYVTKQELRLSPSGMEIQTSTVGIIVKKRAFATDRLCCLRFVPEERDTLNLGRHSSRIMVDRDFDTYQFAFGVSELEGDAIIEKMKSVRNFPEYPKC